MIGSNNHRNYALIGGKEVVFTHQTEAPEHGMRWKDVKYLGEGTYLRTGEKW